MTCDSVLELLCASLDGTLTPAEEEELQAHLQACPRCRALQAELTGIHTACGELDVAAPAELKERILSALPSQKAAKSRHWQRWGAMAAAVAIIAMAAWQLPHHLYQGASDVLPAAGNPAEEAAVEPRDGETSQTTASGEFFGYDTQADDELPAYVSGEGVDVNAYVPSPVSPGDTDAATKAAVYGDFLDKVDLSAAKYKVAQTSAPSDLAECGNTEAENGVAVQSDADAGAEDAPVVVYSSRMATASTEDGLSTGGFDTAVPETAPVMNETEWASSAQPLETVIQTADAFALYCGVLTLEGYQPEAEYPALLLESGEVWYSLPAQDFTDLIRTLDEEGLPYELRLSGEDISDDAPEGLVIVPAAP